MALTVLGSPDFRKGPLNPLFRIAGLSYLGARRRKSPFGGEQWVLSYQSAASKKPTMASPAETGYNLCPVDYTAEIEVIGPIHSLTITTPENPMASNGGIIPAQYELLGNALQFDLREHPKALALGVATLKIINGLLNDERNADGSARYDESQVPAGDATTLYNLLLQRNGNAAFQKSQYVLRYTQIASNRATINVVYDFVEWIYTTAEMLAETGPPPGILSSVANAATTSAPATIPSGYLFGWLKQTPTVTTVANNKIQISGEYWLGLWSTWIYASG